MEELQGDGASWQFDGETIRIQYRTGRMKDSMLKGLGHTEVPVAAVSSVDFRPGEKRKRWTMRLRLRDRADPYAAVGGTLAEQSEPFRLAGPAKSRLLAEYWADQVSFVVDQLASDTLVPADVALGMVPPVPMHIQTVEGTGGFDGATVRLVWSGSHASSQKRKEQRREYPLADLVGVEWVPSDGWQWGHLRVLPRAAPLGPAGKPKHDLHCLLCNEGDEGSAALLLAATITAHLWAKDPDTPTRAELTAGTPRGAHALPATEAIATADAAEATRAAEPVDPDSQVIYERIRQLGRLHAEGILTDGEFATKKAELLDRL